MRAHAELVNIRSAGCDDHLQLPALVAASSADLLV